MPSLPSALRLSGRLRSTLRTAPSTWHITLAMASLDLDVDPTIIPVDRNHEYTIWLSYAEVYNEKVYDLLESVKDGNVISAGDVARKSLVLKRKALALKPSPPSDVIDSGATGKYISGLRQFRVQNAAGLSRRAARPGDRGQ